MDASGLVGRVIAGKYRIDRLLGAGGMGAVFQAENLAISKRVALKFLDREGAADRDAVARFQREAQAASAVESAHIVQIFDSGTSDDGRPYLVMELLQGEDLRQRLRRKQRLELAEALHLVAQVLRGLVRAHAAGIVHRDLKPDNVFVAQRDDEPDFVKIVDFGISKIAKATHAADTLTRRGVVLGTAFYMSPEQARAESDLDGRTDLYAVGAILFEMLAGRPPHVAAAYEATLIDICTRDAPDVRSYASSVPEPVARVIAKALRRDRDRRFATANDFLAALAAAAPELVRAPASSSSGETGDRDTVSEGTTPSQIPEPGYQTDAAQTLHPSRTGEARAQRRRTLVVAVVASLGAFALTAWWMASRQPAPTGPAAESRPDPAARPLAATPPAPRVEPVSAPSASALPVRPTRPTGRPGPAARPAPETPPAASTPKPRTGKGVASGLTIDTREP